MLYRYANSARFFNTWLSIPFQLQNNCDLFKWKVQSDLLTWGQVLVTCHKSETSIIFKLASRWTLLKGFSKLISWSVDAILIYPIALTACLHSLRQVIGIPFEFITVNFHVMLFKKNLNKTWHYKGIKNPCFSGRKAQKCTSCLCLFFENRVAV